MNESQVKWYVFIVIFLLSLEFCLDYASVYVTVPEVHHSNLFIQWPMSTYFLALSILATGSFGDFQGTHHFLLFIGEFSYLASILARFFLSKVMLGRLFHSLCTVFIFPLALTPLSQLFSRKEPGTVLTKIIVLTGLLSALTLLFDLLYLHDFKDKADFILLAIPIYIVLLAFFVGKPIGRLGLLHTILFGLVLTCFSIFFQIFYFGNTSITHILFSFICLSCMWSLGSTLSLLVNDTKHSRIG